MQFRMFGQVEVWSAGRSLEVGTPRQQAVLAALVVDARKPVPIGTLIDRVWHDAPPADPRAVLYSHLSRIRRLLEQASALAGTTAAKIERRHAGYVLDIDPDSVDLHRFRRLADEGGDPRRDDGTRAAALAEALDLWRGPPLAGLPGEWAAQVRQSWDRRRLDAVVRWARLELRLGRPAPVIAALPDLAAEHPLVEPLETLLMRALHATGRGAEALDRYAATRQRLADELGADPGPELRAAHQAVLRGDPPPFPDDDLPARDPAAPEAAPSAAASSAATVIGPAPADTTAAPATAAPATAATDTAATDTAGTAAAPVPEASAAPTGPHRRRTVLATAVAVSLPALIGSVLVLQRDEAADPAAVPPSVERVQVLFARAREHDREGRETEAQAAVLDAVRLYDELVKSNPDRDGRPLATAVIEALRAVGVDASVTDDTLRGWLAGPAFTPYPAVAQAILLNGWRFTRPVFLDVVVWNYEQLPGITPPRDVADVDLDALEAAVVQSSNSRHGTRVTEFEHLLEP